MNAMHMLFLGLNFLPEEVGVGLYSGDMLNFWAKAGNTVEAVVGKPYYPHWRVFEDFRSSGWHKSQEGGIDTLRCPLYVPAEPTGKSRLLHHFSFAISSLLPMVKRARRNKPAFVMTTAPSLIAAPVALLAARMARAKSWLHVQDFEVEAAFATGIFSKKSLSKRLAMAFEKWVLGSFDVVSTISPQMCNHLKAKGVAESKIVLMRNWADIDSVKPRSEPSPYREEWGITTKHVALYSGNISYKQGIGLILEAAEILQHRNDLTFVICGQGPTRSLIERDIQNKGNIIIRDLQPKERLSELLSMASVHLLPQMEGAADLVLPSKLTNMLASGRPVVATAQEGTGLANEVRGVGKSTRPGDAQEFAGAIVSILDDESLAREYGKNARANAIELWSKDKILSEFILRAKALCAKV